MSQRQAKARTTPRAKSTPRRRIEFIAAVRFKDGERQLFAVSNATTAEQARQMVLDEISNVASVLIAQR